MTDSPPRGPIDANETPGVFAWCRCGRTRQPPWCDGSHGGTGIEPLIVELQHAASVQWCGCSRSTTPPYCDRSQCLS
ncbi:MAG: CDGSH iron-sulfur domain-containing protein [Candidatus Eisenbacteria bacterium]|uniref:CDGSH iron-sulfur domain-containing protein n=1 Tax=Eiseniibacteriota bacterium TaxID=2212470 RepID=A0A849SI69_UNCEI|nr:CDGSH iron-sulfur domain-containing protein [Candidatus Eisenbacteria bacterium]